VTVSADVTGVLRQWRQRHDSVLLVFKPTGSRSVAHDVSLELVARAVHAVQFDETAAELDAAYGSAAAWEPWIGPRGPVVYLDPVDTAEALEDWLQRIAAELTRAGWHGRIQPELSTSPPISFEPVPVLTVILGVAGWGTDERRSGHEPVAHRRGASASSRDLGRRLGRLHG
jgi:hypothetical protein